MQHASYNNRTSLTKDSTRVLVADLVAFICTGAVGVMIAMSVYFTVGH